MALGLSCIWLWLVCWGRSPTTHAAGTGVTGDAVCGLGACDVGMCVVHVSLFYVTYVIIII
jgi:hypothetical protein